MAVATQRTGTIRSNMDDDYPSEELRQRFDKPHFTPPPASKKCRSHRRSAENKTSTKLKRKSINLRCNDNALSVDSDEKNGKIMKLETDVLDIGGSKKTSVSVKDDVELFPVDENWEESTHPNIHNGCVVEDSDSNISRVVVTDNNCNDKSDKCVDDCNRNDLCDNETVPRGDGFCSSYNSDSSCDNNPSAVTVSILSNDAAGQSESVNTGTDYSRFKESNSSQTLISPDVWKCIDDDDLDTFSKRLETIPKRGDSPSLSCNARTKKRTSDCFASSSKVVIVDESLVENDESVPSKKIRLDIGKSSERVDSDLTSSPSKGSSLLKKKSAVNKQSLPVEFTPKISDECYVALDCEMVGVGLKGSRSVLGRCSVVDYKGTVLYDKFVKSLEPITDFRTRWSGIRPRDMKTAEPVTKALSEIHQLLQNKIIIGHSVKNDFSVLHYNPHRYLVRDTCKCVLLSKMAQIEGFKQGNGLKNLTKQILGKNIQNNKNGHDSVEDATATLELFKLVREKWEQELFQQWRREGLDVEEFNARLNSRQDVTELIPVAKETDQEVSKDSQCVKESKENVNYLSDEFWPSDILTQS